MRYFITFLAGVGFGMLAIIVRRSLPDARQWQAVLYCRSILDTWGTGPHEVAREVIKILENKE